MGVVFLARDIVLHRLVAIKVLRHELAPMREQRERFRREARVTAQLSCEGIIAVHGFGETADLVYIVMEYVRGRALGSLLAGIGKLEPGYTRAILTVLAKTLDYAHSRGVVHRDLKPENVLLDAESGRPLLTDFGVALSRGLDPLPSDAARAFGTPHFMSPEQAAGETDLDGRSDVYSLGVLGYLMTTGVVPFRGETFAAIASKHIAEPHVPIRKLEPSTPAYLAEAIERCLEKAPDKRWRRASDLAQALTRRSNRNSGQEAVSIIGRSAAIFAGWLAATPR